MEMSAGELKYFLQQRSLLVSTGHGNLAARALIAFKQNLPLLSAAENVINKLEKHYKVLLPEININSNPAECSSDFIDDIKMWPKTNTGQVFTYILSSKAFATEYTGQFKVKKAYS